MSNEVPGLWVDVRLPPDKESSKPGGLESRMVLVSQGEGQAGGAPKCGQHAVAILTKHGRQPPSSEPQASLRGY